MIKLKPLLIALAITTSFSTVVQAGDEARYIVKFKESRTRALKRPSAKALELKVASLGSLALQEIDRIPHDNAAVLTLKAEDVARILTRPDIESVEPDSKVKVLFDTNDPIYSQQYSLNGEFGSRISQAWDTTTGSRRAVVAIIDTGLDLTHPDLAGNLWTNPNEKRGNKRDDDASGCVDDVNGCDFVNKDGSPQDDNGHGTHVAGIVAAIGNNSAGVSGVAWGSRIFAIKALDAQGSGFTSTIAKAIDYITSLKSKGAPIVAINLSLGGGSYSNAIYRAVERARNHDLLIVAAAGNETSNNDINPLYPANLNLDSVISVAATDSTGNLASYSNYGAGTVHIAAPGSQIWSTALQSLGYQYKTSSGTSMASPLVAGVISLISAANPSLSMIQARAVLLSTGRPLESLKGAVITGSLVDANAAVAQARRTQAQVRVAGYVRTRSKRGVSGATVTLTSSSSGATVSRSVTTASDGSYSFNELPLGSYLLKARKSRLQFTAVSFQASSLKLFKRNLDAR
jgi:subtilisin family serine protease